MATEEPTRPQGDPAGVPTAPIPAAPGPAAPGSSQPVQPSPWSRPAYPGADRNWAETTAQLPTPASRPGQPEPTRPLPTAGSWPGQPEPTRPIPAAGYGQYQPPTAPGGQAYAAAGQQAHAQTSQPGYPPAGHPGYYEPGYYQASGHQGYGQQGYGQQGYSGQPGQQQPYYAGQHFYTQPTPPPKRRWPVALVAMLLVFSLGVLGYAVVRNGASASPQLEPYPQTSQTQEPQTGATTEPSSQPSSGSTRSKAVTAAESKGVVLIEAETGTGTAAGTGMILTADGKVLTNYHVVAGSTKLAVTVADSGSTYTATVLGFDQDKDVALLQLKDASGLDTVTVDDDQLAVGDAVAAVGNAEGGGRLVKANGEVAALNRDLKVSSDSPWGSTENLSGMIETSAGAVPGDSGGPMFDSEAEVTGMTTAGSTKEGDSYAVPIATALAVVDQIEAGQDAGTVRVGPAGYLGIEVAGADYTGEQGATVRRVVTNGPADKAGITAGSRITRVGETKVTAKMNVANVVRALEPGSQVEIEWLTPAGRTKTATVTLGSSPVN
jgi:S1-C subfamily serine protease